LTGLGFGPFSSGMAMIARYFSLLLFVVLLSGCSLFHHDPPTSSFGTPAPKKGFSLWPLGKHGPVDATPYLEYRRVPSEAEKGSFMLLARNTHVSKSIEGDIRTTMETGPNQSKVDTTHFTLGPQETKKLVVFPEHTTLTYEVSAFFKE